MEVYEENHRKKKKLVKQVMKSKLTLKERSNERNVSYKGHGRGSSWDFGKRGRGAQNLYKGTSQSNLEDMVEQI